MATQAVKEKIKILKGVLAGNIDFQRNSPPQYHVVIKLLDDAANVRGYTIDGYELTIDQYSNWRKTLRECDSTIELPEQREFKRSIEALPANVEQIATIISPAPSEATVEPAIAPKRKCRERIPNKPKLIPLQDHINFNNALHRHLFP